jgi:formyl-CoA transferase
MPDVQPRLSATPGGVRSAGPALGASTDEILGKVLGLTAGEIEDLRGAGIV